MTELEELLHEEESSTLDFKRDQYPFVGANDGQKSELLKDILAFANAWRRTDAYILIGVDEVRGGISTVTGVSVHLNDADLQQFVNSKINRPITFSYSAVELHGMQVGVIKIPLQKRPFYLKRNFDRLNASVVYLRRGSSTDIASPDEIALIGQDSHALVSRAPHLSLFLVSGKHDEIIEKQLSLNVLNAAIPNKSEFPQYGLEYFGAGPGVRMAHMTGFKNHDYYYNYACHLQNILRVSAIRLSVKNAGNAVARDVKVVLRITSPQNDLIVFHEDRLPDKPSKDTFSASIYNIQKSLGNKDITVKSSQQGIVVTCILGKIQAMDSALSADQIYVGAHTSTSATCFAEIFSDDLEAPITEQLDLSINVTNKTFCVQDLVKFIDK